MRNQRGARLRLSTWMVGLVILVGTVVLAFLAQTVHRSSNQRLDDLQVRQAATTLSAALPTIQTELLDGLQVAQATHSASAFEHFMAPDVGPTGFVSVSLWQRSGHAVS